MECVLPFPLPRPPVHKVTREASTARARQRLTWSEFRAHPPPSSFVNLGAKHVGVFTDPTVANLPVMKVVRPQQLERWSTCPGGHTSEGDANRLLRMAAFDRWPRVCVTTASSLTSLTRSRSSRPMTRECWCRQSPCPEPTDPCHPSTDSWQKAIAWAREKNITHFLA